MFEAVRFGEWWGALFTTLLLLGCVTDIRERRIPNALVVVILGAGFAFSLFAYPLRVALVGAVGGVLLGFGIWIAFWIIGMMGAGDVKFFSATGAWLGVAGVWRAAIIAGVLGGVLAVLTLLRDRQLRRGFERAALAVSSRSVGALRSGTDTVSSRRRQLPYGIALAGGALMAAWLPALLN